MSCQKLDFLNNTLQNISVSLISFYRDVIQEDLNMNTTSVNNRTLSKLRKTIVKKLKKDDSLSICFQSSAVRAAYVFYYCPCFTSAVVFGFVSFLRCVPHYVEKILQQDAFTVCCFGGGPLTEITAIFNVVKDILSNCTSVRTKPLEFNAVVVDVDPGWIETAEKVVSRLKELADTSMLRLNFRFLVHDLMRKPMTDDLIEVLNKSDFVTMVKFLSATNGPSSADLRSRMIQDLCGNMQENGSLFLLDSSGWKFFEEVADVISSCGNMTCIYGPVKQNFRMSTASKAACLQLYSGKCCALRSWNKVSVWCKKSADNVEDSAL